MKLNSHSQGNPAIFVEANIHAREWIASATSTFLINALLYSEEDDIVELSMNVDWYIIPVLNVDGYAYSWTANRLWRKTREPTSNPLCFGTDANRNFDFGFMENNGSSSNPCSEIYAGSRAFSTLEARAVNNYLTAHPKQFNIYLSFHSVGPLILFPYGRNFERADNFDDLEYIGNQTRDALKAVHGTEYRVGSTSELLWTAPGNSVDQAYEIHGIKLGFTIEMRRGFNTGNIFILPKEEIIPNAEEVVGSIVAMVKAAEELEYMDVAIEPTN